MTLAEKIAAQQLYELRKLGWRYTAIHFVGGKNNPFPHPPTWGADESPGAGGGPTWETATIDELVAPEIRQLLRGA